MIKRQKPPIKLTQTFEFPAYISDKPVPLTISISKNELVKIPDIQSIYQKLVFALLEHLKSNISSKIDFDLYKYSSDSDYNPDFNYIHITPGNITIRISPLTTMLPILLTAAEMNKNYITGSFTLELKTFSINYTSYDDNGTPVTKNIPVNISGLHEPINSDVETIGTSFMKASFDFKEELTKKYKKPSVKTQMKKMFKLK